MPAVLTRMRAWFRRKFFWLTPASKTSAEQNPESARDHALVLAVTQPQAVPRWRQLRYASRILSPSERQTMTGALALSCVCLLTALILLASQHLASVPVVGGTYTEAVVGEPQAINPIDAPANDTDRDLASLIYSGLFRMQGMEAVPDLAKSYSWSDDGKMLTVELQKDAYFHNGQAVTADDVQYTIESIQDPTRNSILAPLFKGVAVSIVDDQTVQFSLDQPDATFLIALTVGIVPSDLWQDIPASSARLASLNLKPIGSGPYQVKSFTRDNAGVIRSYTLERFSRYYGIKPNIETITFQFFPDRQSAEDALRSDLVDGFSFVDSEDTQKFQSAARWRIMSLDVPQQTVAFFNLQDGTLKDERVRQALAMGTNRQDFIAAYNGMADVAETPYPFLTPATSTPYDLEGARKLLQAAGWVLPSNDGVRIFQHTDPKATKPPVSTASSTRLTVAIMAPDEPILLKVADLLKRQWSLLGIQVDIQPLDTRTLLRKSSRDRASQVVLWNVLLQPNQDLFPIWWSGQATGGGNNFSGLADKQVDALIDKTEASSSTQMLETTREGLAQAILKDTPAVFLVRPHYSYIISSRVKGIGDKLRLAQPSDRFQDIGQWYIKTGLRWK